MGVLLLVYVSSGVLLAVLSIPLMLKRIRPNPIYGFRIRKTLQNPEVWYQANHYAGKWMLFTGLVTAITAWILSLIPGISVETYSLTCGVISAGLLTLVMIISMRYIQKL